MQLNDAITLAIIELAFEGDQTAERILACALSKVADMAVTEFYDVTPSGAKINLYVVAYWLFWAGASLPVGADAAAREAFAQASVDKYENA